MTKQSALHEAVSAVCPIDGVSVGDWGDRATWRVDFADEATIEQKVAAQSVVDGFDPASVRDVPPPISDRQFFQALAMGDLITKDEAIAAVATGTIPAAMQMFVDALPNEDDRFAATMLLSGAVEFKRDHPLVDAFGAASARTPEQLDDLWRAAAQL